MNSPGSADVAGLTVAFAGAAMIFSLAAAFLVYPRPVAEWFRRHMESDVLVPNLGRKAAAQRMSPGQVVLFAAGSLVVSFIIMWDAGDTVVRNVEKLPVPASAALLALASGCGAFVAGIVLAVRSIGPSRQPRRGGAGVVLSIAALTSVSGLIVAGVSIFILFPR